MSVALRLSVCLTDPVQHSSHTILVRTHASFHIAATQDAHHLRADPAQIRRRREEAHLAEIELHGLAHKSRHQLHNHQEGVGVEHVGQDEGVDGRRGEQALPGNGYHLKRS